VAILVANQPIDHATVVSLEIGSLDHIRTKPRTKHLAFRCRHFLKILNDWVYPSDLVRFGLI